jgi:hypothetical protein
MKPQLQFDWWKFRATLRNIIVTAIGRDITHYFYVCEDEIVGPCGKREILRYSGTYDDVKETREVISDTYDLTTERLYRIGPIGGKP